MWDGESVDRARHLRFYIKEEQNRLENAPLGPRQKIVIQKQIEAMRKELKTVVAEKKRKKEMDNHGGQPSGDSR